LKSGDYKNPRGGKKKLTFRHFEKNCQELFLEKNNVAFKRKKNWVRFHHLATQNNSSTLFYDQ
jgi:hypothetical protein